MTTNQIRSATIAWAVAVLASVIPDQATAQASKNRLQNPSFESGGRTLSGWMRIWPRKISAASPGFAPTRTLPREGDRAAVIDVAFEKGYSSLTQSISLTARTRSVHFEGWARIEDPTRTGWASLVIAFDGAKLPERAPGSLVKSNRVVAGKHWQRISIDASVPDGATRLLARCGVIGPCRAAFDHVSLRTSAHPIESGKMAIAIGDYAATSMSATEEPYVRVSIPLAIGGQTPLAIRVTSDPPESVRGLSTLADRENRPLEIRLRPMEAAETIALRVETWTMLRDRKLSDGKNVALPNPRGRLPETVALHVASAPGVEIEAPIVIAAGKALEVGDLATTMQSLIDLLSQRLDDEGGGNQGAVSCLASGKGVCTGYANTAAAVLNSRGIPTRIVACTFADRRLQEHYLVETWTKTLGWSRCEPQGGFPYGDTRAMVLRIVYPDSWRSSGNVPLYLDAATGVEASRRSSERMAWQSGRSMGSFAIPVKGFTKLEKRARAAFEALSRQPHEGAVWRAFTSTKRAPKDAAAVVKDVLEWAASTGTVEDEK